jgi:rfaE bifunctional protein nucleotidyltransferase chain/domain
MNYNFKIKTKEEIARIVTILRETNQNIQIVTTNGAFDLIHAGHVRTLQKAKSFGEVLIVGLNSDSSIKAYKSPLRPIIPQLERAEMLAALEVVNYVVIFDETNPIELLKLIKPNFHVKSKAGYKGFEGEVVESNGGRIILLEDIPGFSTTNLIQRIKEVLDSEKS